MTSTPTPDPPSAELGFADLDRTYMRTHGRITLYLNTSTRELTNWPGTLRFRCGPIREGRHNLAGRRYDTWFTADGETWHAVQYGDNTTIAHCRRVKG